METEMKIAVLIDAENIASKYTGVILNEANSLGDIIIKRIYGDWTARQMSSWKDVVLDKKRHTVRLKRAGMKITLGGIAKGYAVDRAAALLDTAGFTNFIVQAGGDMYVSGDKAGTPWVVGIRDPRGTRDETFAVAPIRDHSFSTSGDYERGFVKDGVRYHHILDPRTGQPARASRAVTIMAKDAFTADAWSKVLFILGAKDAMALVEKLPDFEAVWVDADNRVIASSGLKDREKMLHEPTPGPRNRSRPAVSETTWAGSRRWRSGSGSRSRW